MVINFFFAMCVGNMLAMIRFCLEVFNINIKFAKYVETVEIARLISDDLIKNQEILKLYLTMNHLLPYRSQG